MFGTNRLNINWKDDNHCHVQDPNTGQEYEVTVRPKSNMFTSAGRPVKSQLYVGGVAVDEYQDNHTHRQTIAWAKEEFGSFVSKLLNREVRMKFSRYAGCSCSCSPGFIIDQVEGGSILPFNIWVTMK